MFKGNEKTTNQKNDSEKKQKMYKANINTYLIKHF